MILTVKNLIDIMKKHNIPFNASITSDSGWECGATYVSSVFYDIKENQIVLCSAYPNLENRVGQIAIIPGDRTSQTVFSQTGFRFDYYIDEETKIVMQGEDKRP